jgi:predicted NUDIX family NTP pyrophosphohydrolase
MTRKSAANTSTSAGLLMFRRSGSELEVFLAHPGGPFWKQKDAGAWTIPKGLVDENEDLLAAARREFLEETGIEPVGPFHELGTVRQKAGKLIHAWAWEGDADPTLVRSNTFSMEYPRGSGRMIEVPEIDRCEWFSLAVAREKINPAQIEFLDRLQAWTDRAPAERP